MSCDCGCSDPSAGGSGSCCSLSDTLVVGNTTGGEDIVVSASDSIVGESALQLLGGGNGGGVYAVGADGVSAGGGEAYVQGGGSDTNQGGNANLIGGNGFSGGNATVRGGSATGATAAAGGSVTLEPGLGGSSDGLLQFKMPALAYAFRWPNVDGVAAQTLKTDGAGALGWHTPPIQQTLTISGSASYALAANVAYYNRVLIDSECTFGQMAFDLAVTAAPSNFELGVYNATGTLLRKTAAFAAAASGTYVTNLTAPLYVARGQFVWLAIWTATARTIKGFQSGAADGVRTQQGGLGTLPASFVPYSSSNTLLPWLALL